MVAWGSGYFGQTNVPAGLTNVVGIAGGGYHSMALLANGTAIAWGNNAYGQTIVPSVPTNMVAIAAGVFHSLALLDPKIIPCLSEPVYGNGVFRLSLRTFLRRNYSLESMISLEETNWTPVSLFPGNGVMKTVTDTNANASQRFYRVRVE